MTTDHSQRLIGAYYFRAGMFTMVPEHVRAQLDDMAAMGTDVVCLAVNDRDLVYNHANLAFLVDESHARGMQVYFVPSRIAGITAGAPLTADGLGYVHPHTWTINQDGTPLVRNGMGVVCSFYHPEVEAHFITVVSQMITDYAIDGIIWDEPKSTNWQDFSDTARANNPDADFRIYMQDMAAFFSRINARLKTLRPDLVICHFDEACRRDEVAEESARIEHLDYYGTDGVPAAPVSDDPACNRRDQKVLPFYGERYLTAAKANGCKTLALVENQRLSAEGVRAFAEAMPAIMQMDIDFMIYYYYGFVQDDVEGNMDVVRQHIARPPARSARADA